MGMPSDLDPGEAAPDRPMRVSPLPQNAVIPRPGAVTLAATPIGNPLDASVRLVRALEGADVIAAEDTRRLARLAADLGIRTTAEVMAYHEHNESERTPELIEAAQSGRSVVVVTDAGMPVVSDPGFRAVQAAIAADVPVEVLPGPSAVLTALASSGLAPDRFAFEGFLPRRDSKRDAALRALADEPRTLVLFESPRRTATTLAAMAEILGADRPAALCRELTKTHEEIVRGTLGELAERARTVETLGEVVLVVDGAPERQADPEALVDAVLDAVERGQRLKDATREIAGAYPGVTARDLYSRALERRA